MTVPFTTNDNMSMNDLCFITGDFTCNNEYEDCSKCPTYIHEVEKDTDKDLPWRVATLTDLQSPSQNG